MKKVLITGGKGQLAKAFGSDFGDFYNINSLSKNELDITNEVQVEHALKNYNPDIILNCAAYTDVDGAEENFKHANNINANSIKHLLKNFKGLFIYISTDYVFDGKSGPYDNLQTVNPINKYGLSKLNGEKIARELSNNLILLRTNVLFDLRSKASFLKWVIESLKNEKKIEVVDDQICNPISSNDLSFIINNLITNEKRGLFHSGSSKFISRFKFAKMIAQNWGLNENLISNISTEYLEKKIDSYVAKRPLKSGLIPNQDLPLICLKKSLENLRKTE